MQFIGNFFYSFFILFISLLFLIFGGIGLLLPWSSSLQEVFRYFLQERGLLFSLFSTLVVVLSLAVTAFLFHRGGRKVIHIRMGEKGISIDRKLIDSYLRSYWGKIFPKEEISFDCTIRRESIQIRAALPSVPEPEQEVIIERIRKDLHEIFYHLLGYSHDIHLSLSFPLVHKKEG